MRVEKPTTKVTIGTEKYAELIEAAEGSPGEWFAEDYDGTVGAQVRIYTHFGRKLVEVRTTENKTVYLRVKDDS